MGLNVSNRQIAKELNVSEKTAQSMTDKLRTRVEKNNPDVMLSGEVEFDDVAECIHYATLQLQK